MQSQPGRRIAASRAHTAPIDFLGAPEVGHKISASGASNALYWVTSQANPSHLSLALTNAAIVWERASINHFECSSTTQTFFVGTIDESCVSCSPGFGENHRYRLLVPLWDDFVRAIKRPVYILTNSNKFSLIDQHSKIFSIMCKRISCFAFSFDFMVSDI